MPVLRRCQWGSFSTTPTRCLRQCRLSWLPSGWHVTAVHTTCLPTGSWPNHRHRAETAHSCWCSPPLISRDPSGSYSLTVSLRQVSSIRNLTADRLVVLFSRSTGICDFLLVTNSNFGPGLHRSEIQRLIGRKLQIFPTTLSFNTLARVEPFRIAKTSPWAICRWRFRDPSLRRDSVPACDRQMDGRRFHRSNH